MPSSYPLSAPQIARLHRFDVTRCVDVHCHCLPGIDDGPPTVVDAVALCRLLVRDGFTDVIATPHQLGRWDGLNWAPDVRAAVREMQAVLENERVPLRIHAGGEVRIDERIPRLLESDLLLTLGDGTEYLLLELPSTGVVSPQTVVEEFRGVPLTIVLAHAERYESLRRDPASVQAWLDAGVVIQLNAPSLLGDGPHGSRDAAYYWLENGWVSLVATDAHGVTTRRPRMTEAIEFLVHNFGFETARRLCVTNPIKLLEGEENHPRTASG